MLVPGFVLKTMFERVGQYVGGPFGAALGAFMATSMVLTAEVSEAAKKVADGKATFTEITA